MSEGLTEPRKLDHIRIALEELVDMSGEERWFDGVELLHNPLPDISFDEVDLTVEFLSHKISAPILIEGMTGGHEATKRINEELAKAASEFGVPIGVGSQRAALEKEELAHTYKIVREIANNVPVIANLGISHVIGSNGVDNAKKAVDMIEADAIAIHLNPLQEVIQPEGDHDLRDGIVSIRDLVKELDVPVIVKEVGSGIRPSVAKLLDYFGVYAIDVAGSGGTSWALIEGERASDRSKERTASQVYKKWGIPTPAAILSVSEVIERAKLIGSGGVRNGLDAAKCLALGADMVGAARPFLKAVVEGKHEGVIYLLNNYSYQLKIAVFLSGARNIPQFKNMKNYLLLEPLSSWVRRLLM